MNTYYEEEVYEEESELALEVNLPSYQQTKTKDTKLTAT